MHTIALASPAQLSEYFRRRARESSPFPRGAPSASLPLGQQTKTAQVQHGAVDALLVTKSPHTRLIPTARPSRVFVKKATPTGQLLFINLHREVQEDATLDLLAPDFLWVHPTVVPSFV